MVKVRPAEQWDITAIAELEKELFSDAWSEHMLSDCLGQKHYAVTVCAEEIYCPGKECRAGLEDDLRDAEKADCIMKVTGYLITTHVAGEAELLRIGVSPDRRRRGIGSLLMERLIRLCAERDTPHVFLEVRAGNRSAISLYERFGFNAVGTRKNYYHHPEEDAYLMAGKMPD